MPNIKISQLPSATSVTSADLIEIVQSGTSKKAAISLVNAYPGTGDRILEASASGTVSATKTYKNPWITDSYVISQLEGPNWGGGGEWEGPNLNVNFGDVYVNDSFEYKFRIDNSPYRTALV